MLGASTMDAWGEGGLAYLHAAAARGLSLRVVLVEVTVALQGLEHLVVALDDPYLSGRLRIVTPHMSIGERVVRACRKGVCRLASYLAAEGLDEGLDHGLVGEHHPFQAKEQHFVVLRCEFGHAPSGGLSTDLRRAQASHHIARRQRPPDHPPLWLITEVD